MHQIRKTHDISNNCIVWAIDVKFSTIAREPPVAWSICVRETQTDAIILNTLVDYRMSMGEVHGTLLKHATTYSTSERQSRFLRREFVQYHYDGDYTSGITLDEVGKAIVSAGFKPETHRVLSWYSAHDITTFKRILLGNNDMVLTWDEEPRLVNDFTDSTTGESCLQTINVVNLLRESTNLAMMKCGYTHRSLFPSVDLQMHKAENDTLAMCQIYYRFLIESAAWVATLQ
jgi:hypothetical protein